VAHPPDPREFVPVAPEFFVPDVAAAVRYYTQTLGFTEYRVEPEFAVVGLGPAQVLLADERMYGRMGGHHGAPVERGAMLDIRIMVPDVDEIYDRLRRAGVEIVHDIADRPYGLRDFIIRDLNGFRLRFAAPLG
jgi:uncharacterized glyoxalase superfamily protein PhnB